MSKNRIVVERYFDALNSADFSELREVFSPDIELIPVGARSRTGVEEVVGFLARVFEIFPDHQDLPTRIIEAGDTLVVEIDFVGKSSEDREVAFQAVDVFDLIDGRIIKLSQWFDTADLARQVDKSS